MEQILNFSECNLTDYAEAIIEMRSQIQNAKTIANPFDHLTVNLRLRPRLFINKTD